ncbi:DUF2619 domain-containing protein [Bacillus sp. RAR_GA_16]|uniref:DUF2619 domain-containing protein n=1 Tax=Bacillus sp. RAR_GA_16 TaxID=2876774 RepID=UPI001CCCDF32|nr:DUF2619 domain-containing protein [Bacillus sp. RAR_GA_16]MCA0171114.1 YqhV family protein [Bacillus sp. RAR_GA_16]
MIHSVLVMGLLRLLSGVIELISAILILIIHDLKTAMIINAALAIVGPVILVTTMTVGLIGLAGDLSILKILLILVGVGFILIGTLS